MPGLGLDIGNVGGNMLYLKKSKSGEEEDTFQMSALSHHLPGPLCL